MFSCLNDWFNCILRKDSFCLFSWEGQSLTNKQHTHQPFTQFLSKDRSYYHDLAYDNSHNFWHQEEIYFCFASYKYEPIRSKHQRAFISTHNCQMFCCHHTSHGYLPLLAPALVLFTRQLRKIKTISKLMFKLFCSLWYCHGWATATFDIQISGCTMQGWLKKVFRVRWDIEIIDSCFRTYELDLFEELIFLWMHTTTLSQTNLKKKKNRWKIYSSGISKFC